MPGRQQVNHSRGWVLGLVVLTGGAVAEPLQLHVPSPEWADQIIYFVMLDRFNDGNPANNDQGAGEFNPADNAYYSGGDLRGLSAKLDYIRGLGATAVWITPPVANQWWDAGARYSGYHGYWAENFSKVDAHYGTLADYQGLSDRLHRAGMYLVQDIVVNHTGNFFRYPDTPPASDPAQGYQPGGSAPSQSPFDLNDARRRRDRKAAIYHWTPDIRDFADLQQQENFQLAGLDDLNTENPQVRRALRRRYGHWIKAVGVDAFRVDTAFYVPPDYFSDFMYSGDRKAPGMQRVAAQTGRQQFHVFGEGFGIDPPYTDVQARRIDSYMRSAQGRPRLPGMLNFPLYGSALDVFARGRPTAELGYRIRSMQSLHAHPELLPSFVDNHDVDRFLAGGSVAGLKQALLLIMSLPGIPTIYYGTEQGLTEQRAAMFRGGYGSAGRDHFDTSSVLYRFLQRVTALRRDNRLFSRGRAEILKDSPVPGVLAYRMRHGADSALVLFNTAEHECLLERLPTDLPPGSTLVGLFGLDGVPAKRQVDASGTLTLRLPARSGLVWKPGPVESTPAPNAVRLELEALDAVLSGGDRQARGRLLGTDQALLVIDGDLSSALPVQPDAKGRFELRLPTDSFIDPEVEHRAVLWSEASGALSASRSFTVERQWQLLREVADPDGDDRGPTGAYQYPADPSWSGPRPLDLRGARVWASGGSLKLELKLRQLVSEWNSSNGFDHVAFSVFFEVPGASAGSRIAPLQQTELPAAMRWHYRLRLHGWSNAWFSAAGASASSEGTASGPAPSLQVDRQRQTLTIQIPASAFGRPVSWSGGRIYVNTWDYDGGYRPLAPTAGPHTFGGAAADQAKVLDELLIELP